MGRQYDNRGRDQINFENVQGNVILPEDRRVERSRSELILLKAVSDEVTSRLSQSLHNAVLINLDKQVQPQQVKRHWDAEIKIGALPSQPLPPETKILDVFERSDIQGKLLILGAPGAGKTTTLLDLAQGLVERAIADPTAPIPVIFTLSSWKDPKQLMKDWLIAELKSKYGVRIDIGKKWIEDKQLLPLLDGLDEVKPEHQKSCLNAINRLLESDDRPSDLVVCSRREEYENYQVRLHLNGAIRLQALTDEQIQQYFHTLKQPQMWQTMQLDVALLELIRTPLFLAIVELSVTEQKFSFSDWQALTSREARLQYLFDVFWEAAIDRVLVEPRLSAQGIQSKTYWKTKPPTAKQTRRWLTCLAQQLQKESETEFLIEKMQPSWLSAYHHSAYIVILGFIFTVINGLVSGAILGLRDGIIFGAVYGLHGGLSALTVISPVEKIQFFIRALINTKNSQRLVIGMVGMFLGMCFGMPLEVLYGTSLALVSGVLSGLILTLALGLLKVSKVELTTRIYPNQGIFSSAKNTFIVLTISFIAASFTQALLFPLLNHVSFGEVANKGLMILLIGLIWYVVCENAGQACIQHFSLRFVLFFSRSIPWNYARFLNYATERLFLQRVGGRYRFIHKLLQEHFAEMEVSDPLREER